MEAGRCDFATPGKVECTRYFTMAQAPERRRFGGRAWLLMIAVGMIGCSAPPPPVGIVPDSSTGRRALEVAMEGWKAGRPTGVVEPTIPGVQVVDTHRRPGQALEGFEILGESPDERARTFTVRLRLSSPEERPVVRFLVVGIDPILVFRQEDYELLMHWEHRMEPEPEEGATSPPGTTR